MLGGVVPAAIPESQSPNRKPVLGTGRHEMARERHHSLYRDLRVRALLEPHIGAITRSEVKDALFDDFESPWSVCRPPRLNTSSNLSASVAMVLMEPELGIMEVAMLPALNRRFTQYNLQMDIRRPTSAVAGQPGQRLAASAGG